MTVVQIYGDLVAAVRVMAGGVVLLLPRVALQGCADGSVCVWDLRQAPVVRTRRRGLHVRRHARAGVARGA